MKKKLVAAFLTFTIFVAVCAPLTVQAGKPGWDYENGSWYYYFNSTYYYQDTVKQIPEGGEYYFFYPSGKMGVGWCKREYDYDGTHYEYWFYASSSGALMSGWQQINGTWYYFDKESNCVMYSNRLATINGKRYSFSSSGAMQTGWIRQSGTNSEGTTWESWFYADSSGALVKDWQKIKGVWYYFGSNNIMYSNLMTKIDGKTYYFYPSGAMAIGWIRMDYSDSHGNKYTNWYYADSSGELVSGWKKIGGAWYYFSESGSPYMYTGSSQINGVWYVLQNSGALVSWNGWAKYITYDGTVQWFYCNSSGYPTMGWKWIDGAYYYFDSRGIMYQNTITWIDGKKYVFGSSGALITAPGWQKLYDKKGKPRWVYMNNDGTVFTGWLQQNDKWYYLNPYDGGYMAKGGLVIDGVLNLFNNSGVWTGYQYEQGWYYLNDTWFYVKSDGKAALEWNDIDAQTYYFSYPGGEMYYGGLKYIDSKPYFFYPGGQLGTGWIVNEYGETFYSDSSGILQTGWQIIYGKKYYFDPDNYIMYQSGIYNIDGTQYAFDENGVCIPG